MATEHLERLFEHEQQKRPCPQCEVVGSGMLSHHSRGGHTRFDGPFLSSMHGRNIVLPSVLELLTILSVLGMSTPRQIDFYARVAPKDFNLLGH